MQLHTVAILILGMVVGGVSTEAYLTWQTDRKLHMEDMVFMAEHGSDQVHDEYHTHIDFVAYISGERLDFTKDEYQSTAKRILHEHVHLHDKQGDIVHYHGPGVTFIEFFDSIGYTLTDTCFTTPAETEYCSDGAHTLALFVNDEQYPGSIASYIAADEDRVLLYYGDLNHPDLPTYLSEVDDRACIYSGTCPERGTAPPEECGLTCEL